MTIPRQVKTFFPRQAMICPRQSKSFPSHVGIAEGLIPKRNEGKDPLTTKPFKIKLNELYL